MYFAPMETQGQWHIAASSENITKSLGKKNELMVIGTNVQLSTKQGKKKNPQVGSLHNTRALKSGHCIIKELVNHHLG